MNRMHQVLTFLIALVGAADISQNCLFCKKEDTNSGFMYSYSWCEPRNTCLENAWNFYNQKCEDGWTSGFRLDAEVDC